MTIDEAAAIVYGPTLRTLPAIDEAISDRLNDLLERQKRLKFGATCWYAVRLNAWLMCRLTDPLPITHAEALAKLEELTKNDCHP